MDREQADGQGANPDSGGGEGEALDEAVVAVARRVAGREEEDGEDAESEQAAAERQQVRAAPAVSAEAAASSDSPQIVTATSKTQG